MMNNSTYEFYDIEYVIPLIKLYYGIEPNEYEVKDIAIHKLKQIGNVWFDRFLFIGQITDNKIELPCNVHTIESVTSGNYSEEYIQIINADYANQMIAGNHLTNNTYITRGFSRLPDRTAQGNFVDYRFVKENNTNMLYFNKLFITDDVTLQTRYDTDNKQYDKMYISVLYNGQLVDRNGLPMITEDEAMAIAYCWITIDLKKKIMLGLNNGSLLQDYEKNHVKYTNLARQPNKINQNLMNEMLNTAKSANLSTYGKSYKY